MTNTGLGIYFAKHSTLISKLRPRGFVLATGLFPLVSKTAFHVFECLLHRRGLAAIRGEPYARTVVRILISELLTP